MTDRDDDGGLEWWQTTGQWDQESRETTDIKERKDMGLIFKAPEGGSKYAPAPAGSQPARCISVIDLGTQTTNFQGESKSSKRVQLTWEIPGERMEDGRPFTISRKYTATLHENGKLYEHLVSWRGKKFTEAEIRGWDSRKLLGQPCMLNIVHDERDGKTYANVKTVSPLPKGLTVPEAENKPVFLDLDDFDEQTFQSLSKYTQEMIAASPEYQRAAAPGALTAAGGVEDSDIPF